MESITSSSKSTLSGLHRAAFTYPAIDNHAHALLNAKNRANLPFEGVISESEGDALIMDAPSTLVCHRATHQLAALFGLSEDSSWEVVKAKRAEFEYIELCKRSFKPTAIQCILIDDGLGARDTLNGISWHDQFTYSPSKRVVRVETVAEDILMELIPIAEDGIRAAFNIFTSRLLESLMESARDDSVAGFKSVICYRSGLGVSPGPDPRLEPASEEVFLAFSHLLATRDHEGRERIRLQEKVLNDYVVRLTLGISATCDKPVQFHTGLGDSDLMLALSSPSHLQPVIKAYPKTKIVLLHSSYPFTRESGYLTTVYSNVFLDFGEIFPYVSGHGQRSVIRQMLELTPTNKIMWSTDGHFWPESYYLGTIQARQALYEVLGEIVHAGELSEESAIQIVQNILFHNANRIYNLGLEAQIDKSMTQKSDIETLNSTFDFL